MIFLCFYVTFLHKMCSFVVAELSPDTRASTRSAPLVLPSRAVSPNTCAFTRARNRAFTLKKHDAQIPIPHVFVCRRTISFLTVLPSINSPQ
jgi:hypothetical protein